MSKLCVALMGLPARGKSTLTRRIKFGLEELGVKVAIFNNGDLRRKLLGLESAKPDFFAPYNEEGRMARERIALMNMEEAKKWLNGEGRVAIIDATHGTAKQRELVRKTMGYPVLFIECLNEDELLLEASMRNKTRLPEFIHLSEEVALQSFKKRIAHYASVYSPLTQAEEGCWIRVDAVDDRILDEKPYDDLPYYAAIRDMISSHWVQNLYLVRHGETEYNLSNRIGGNPPITKKGLVQAVRLSEHFKDFNIPYLFTSGLLRTNMTAQPLLVLKPETQHIAMSEFNEIDAGICEGMTYEEVREKMPEQYKARAADKYNYTYPEGESYDMLRERVGRGLRRALFLATGGDLMIIGHQAVNRAILSLLLYKRPEDVPYTYIPQSQYYHITITQRRKLFELTKY